MTSTGTFTFTPNLAGLQRLVRDPNGPGGQFMNRLGNSAVNEAKARANVDTGYMRGRIDYTVDTGPGGVLRLVLAARTNYAVFVHDGTKWYRGNPFLRDGAAAALNRL